MSRGGYIQIKGGHFSLKNALAHGPVYFGLKALGPHMKPLFHNNGQIFQEILPFHMNLPQAGQNKVPYWRQTDGGKTISEFCQNVWFCSPDAGLGCAALCRGPGAW